MKFIGLLMVNEENDILERTLDHNAQFVDEIYALDADGAAIDAIMRQGVNVAGYYLDEHPSEYGWPTEPCDGYRGFLLERAIRDHGPDNWFVLLHGDELWTEDPRETAAKITRDRVAVVYNLPFFIPRDGEPWDYDVHPIDQLHWRLGPGWPEVRMFKGGPGVRYRPDQHFNVTPEGIDLLWYADAEILHYPYRSPEQQQKRAAVSFDPDNYRRIGYWTDDMIRQAMEKTQFSQLTSTLAVAA